MVHQERESSGRDARVALGCARGGLFSGLQLIGWGAVVFNGCVAQNCHNAMAGDNLGTGIVFVVALGALVALASAGSVASGFASVAAVWPSRTLRWAGIALAVAGVLAAIGAGGAVRSCLCPYFGNGGYCDAKDTAQEQ